MPLLKAQKSCEPARPRSIIIETESPLFSRLTFFRLGPSSWSCDMLLRSRIRMHQVSSSQEGCRVRIRAVSLVRNQIVRPSLISVSRGCLDSIPPFADDSHLVPCLSTQAQSSNTSCISLRIEPSFRFASRESQSNSKQGIDSCNCNAVIQQKD